MGTAERAVAYGGGCVGNAHCADIAYCAVKGEAAGIAAGCVGIAGGNGADAFAAAFAVLPLKYVSVSPNPFSKAPPPQHGRAGWRDRVR